MINSKHLIHYMPIMVIKHNTIKNKAKEEK